MDGIATQGISLPKLGLGTFKLKDDACREAVESALALGYRHLDTAEMYGNEAPIGDAIAASSVKRGELHVTTKVWHDHLAPDAIRRAFDESLKNLRLDFVDLYLVHWPAPDMNLGAIFDTLVKLKDEGRARAIGVCNFPVALLRQAIDEIGAPVACNQIEYHAMLDQDAVLSYLHPKNIPIIAYCPLAQGRMADDPTMAVIGKKHGVSAAQGAEMAARSGRRCGDSESRPSREPASQSRRVEDHARRRRPPGHRGDAEGPSLRQSGLRPEMGLRSASNVSRVPMRFLLRAFRRRRDHHHAAVPDAAFGDDVIREMLHVG